MATTILSSKGQIVIPSHLRKRMHLTAGTTFTILETDQGLLLKKDTPRKRVPASAVAGILKPKVSLTLEEIDAMVAEQFVKEYRDRR